MMSENLVSKPMSGEDSYGSRMYPVTVTQGSSMENILMESQGSLNYNSKQPQLFMSDIQGPQSQQLRVVVSEEISGAHSQVGPLGHMVTNTDVQKVLVPNWPVKQMQSLETNSGEQKSLLPNKRKAASELISKDPAVKKVAQTSSLFNYSVMPAVPVPSRKVVPMGSGLNSPRLMTSNKKKLPADSGVNRSQPLAQKNRNARVDAPNKAESASSYFSVRSKLKESLAAALALVLQGREDPSIAEKNVSSLAGSKKLRDSQSPKSAPGTGIASSPDPGKSGEPAGATLLCPIESSSATIDPKHNAGDSVETWKFVGQEFQSNPVLSYEDASFNDGFFGKDELLMGNGLTWAMELDVDIADVNEGEESKKAKLEMHLDAGNDKKPLPSPDFVASEIEAELFKLFGGVNKKYKEKGRSLLFNLKDKSNPDLRESVMSGKIPPEKLCSMSAEELASKELSEWRIAKTEEFDHMKVLPDTEVDLRRLVKKTHKGEFQVVEVERDVSVPVDIAVVSSTLYVDQPQDNRMKGKHSRAESPVQADKTRVKEELSGKKSNNGDPDSQCQLTIPSDTADVMHGLMVDDIKDLPPIVSLDEFMESLDKEPPFENLRGDSGTTPRSGKETSDVGCSAGSSDQISKDPEKKAEHKSGEVDSKSIISNANVKSTSSVEKGPEIYPASGLIKGERVWEGLLQLSISSMANFVGIFKSGEKTSTKDWPRFFEIKGRVRLDAFQRFLQDLPMSRSRAVMVVHFALAEGCTEDDHKNLKELVDSYVVDQRLGFAEPASGFEVYFIPPQTATLDMLSKQLTEYYTKTLKTIDNGLIGIVVWRKAHVTPTTHHKDNSKRQQHQPYSATISSKQKDPLNTNVNFASKSVTSPSIMSRSRPNNYRNVVDDDDNDDDVPPGFGPPNAQNDDDDLPEFKFSGSGRGGLSPSFSTAVPQRLSSPTPSRSVDQVRQLIQKYGKTENDSVRGGIALQPWDDDDDDDIPEWQPEAPPALPPPNVANVVHTQQPLMPPNGGGGWWHGGPPNVQSVQQRQWRSDGNRSRGRGY
ncbi:hypothetical protein V2J09_009373 [Rumex salicifolius]